jgi:hypothetical protein
MKFKNHQEFTANEVTMLTDLIRYKLAVVEPSAQEHSELRTSLDLLLALKEKVGKFELVR